MSIAPWLKHHHKPRIGAEWLFLRGGVGASNHFEAGGFVRSNDRVAYPNLMFHFLPIAIRYDGSQPAAEHGYQVHLGRCTPTCAATCGSARPTPSSTPPCSSTTCRPRPTAARVDRDGARARRILSQPAFAAFSAGEISPGPLVETDQEILDWVAKDAETALHPSCTARMGTDDMAVLDPSSMKVHGVDGVRVVDASSMPYVTNGNIYAPVMMLAEKAADLIAGHTPLPPLDVPFYRHGSDTPLWPEGDPRNDAAAPARSVPERGPQPPSSGSPEEEPDDRPRRTRARRGDPGRRLGANPQAAGVRDLGGHHDRRHRLVRGGSRPRLRDPGVGGRLGLHLVRVVLHRPHHRRARVRHRARGLAVRQHPTRARALPPGVQHRRLGGHAVRRRHRDRPDVLRGLRARHAVPDPSLHGLHGPRVGRGGPRGHGLDAVPLRHQRLGHVRAHGHGARVLRYRLGLPLAVRSALYPLLGKRVDGRSVTPPTSPRPSARSSGSRPRSASGW